jgi:hypothetical protein
VSAFKDQVIGRIQKKGERKEMVIWRKMKTKLCGEEGIHHNQYE